MSVCVPGRVALAVAVLVPLAVALAVAVLVLVPMMNEIPFTPVRVPPLAVTVHVTG